MDLLLDHMQYNLQVLCLDGVKRISRKTESTGKRAWYVSGRLTPI